MTLRRWAGSVAALMIYTLYASALLLPPLLRQGAGAVIGNHTPDVVSFIWYLAWWPYALTHGINPLHSALIWWPVGINLIWTTSIGVVAVLLWPVTALFGPIVSYNVAALMAPPLLAWGTFELCRETSGAFWPAVFGGWVVGFSSYEFRELLNHVHCYMLFPLPLLAWLSVRRFKEKSGRLHFIGIAACLWIMEFGISTEFFATAVMLGAAGLAAGWLMAPDHAGRHRWQKLSAEIGLSVGMGVAVIALVAGRSLFTGYAGGKLWSAGVYSVDPANWFVPTYTTWLGSHGMAFLWRLFAGQSAEQGAYLGIPLIAMVMVGAYRMRKSAAGRWLAVMLAFTALLALGPQIHVLNQKLPVPLPWLFLSHVPIIQKALPCRLMAYLLILMAVVAAGWMAETHWRPGYRIFAAALAIIFLIPNTPAGLWATRFHTPRLFATAAATAAPTAVRANVGGILIFPFGYRGWSMLWQMESHFPFAMVDGYTGTVPGKYGKSGLVQIWLSKTAVPSNYPQRLDAFLARQHIKTILAVGPFNPRLRKLIAPLGKPVATCGRVLIFGRMEHWMGVRMGTAARSEMGSGIHGATRGQLYGGIRAGMRGRPSGAAPRAAPPATMPSGSHPSAARQQ